MIKIYQDTFGTTLDSKDPGNCFPTCLGCILEIKCVPNFMTEGENWWDATQRWLSKYGLYYFEFVTRDKKSLSELGYHTIIGKSPRANCNHCVVGFGGEIVHDPHPSNLGLVSRDLYGFIVPKDIASYTTQKIGHN